MLAKAAVWIAAGFLLLSVVLGGQGRLGLGLGEQPPRSDDLAQRIVIDLIDGSLVG